MSRHLGWRLAAVLLVHVVAGWLAVTRPARLGLDLRGGTQIVLETRDGPRQRVDDDTVARTLEVLRRRVDQLGVTEPTLQRSGARRVLVELPGVYDPEEAVRVIGRTAQLIGPTIGAELRRKALIALGIALLVQLAYLAVRFRWTFGAAAVIAMFHDVAILLGLFAWLGKPLDGVFLAALLTVIGYSVNDSVVVFDRIRERLRERRREPLGILVNQACLQTIPRTVNTGLGALFILAALFVLGGDTLTDFALALLVGILVGTYSSVLVAAPLLVAFERRSGRQPTAAPQPATRQPVRPAATVAMQSAPVPGGKRVTTARTTTSTPRPNKRKQPTRRKKGRRR